MAFFRQIILVTLTITSFAGAASAVPIVFQLDNVTITDPAFPTSQTYIPGFSIIGSGDLDLFLGTGLLTLPDYSILIDVQLNGPDAQLDITNWSQTITSIDGSGNIVSIGGGTTACTNLGGLGGFVCAALDPNVAGWPPVDGTPPLLSSAIIDTNAQTITVVDNATALAGTITQFFSYSVVPEPSALLLTSAGLVGLGTALRRQARC